MSINEDKAERVSQWRRHLLNVSGWLVLFVAIILALRPTVLPSPLNSPIP